MPPQSADVVVVGAGPAGLAVTSALWHLGVRDVVVLDEASRPCGRFFDRVDSLRQRVLRSPYEHHPGVEGYRDCELLDFARLHWAYLTDVERREIRMAQAGHRSVVPVDVFEAYCRHVAALHGVPERRWQTRVDCVEPGPDGVVVRAADGCSVAASHVVLCLGEQRRPAPAAWLRDGVLPAGVQYWDEPVPAGDGGVVVVGAGLTAAHLIHNALNDGRLVDWVIRAESERYQCADVNAQFFRAEGRARFDGKPWDERMTWMRAHRRASVMFEFQPILRQAEADGRLRVHREQDVAGLEPQCVQLSNGHRVKADAIVLALGTAVSSGAPLLPDDVVGVRDGWPDLDPQTLAYRAAPRVFAVGAAAGMILGPAARNIDGHRVATARVATAIARGLSVAPDVELQALAAHV